MSADDARFRDDVRGLLTGIVRALGEIADELRMLNGRQKARAEAVTAMVADHKAKLDALDALPRGMPQAAPPPDPSAPPLLEARGVSDLLPPAPAGSRQGHAGPAAPAPPVDDDAADPFVTKDPGGWTGASRIGHRMGECSPEYLDLLAGAHTRAANRLAQQATAAPDDDRRARSDEHARLAALAKGHADRLRAAAAPKPKHTTITADAVLGTGPRAKK